MAGGPEVGAYVVENYVNAAPSGYFADAVDYVFGCVVDYVVGA